jgi:hypothetical protein
VSGTQVSALIGLRWRMVRSRRAQRGFAALAATVPLLCLAAVITGLLLPRAKSFEITLLAPTAYLSVALLAIIAPLVAGGGNDLFPSDQLVAYPLTGRTQYVVSLALTPLNLAWTTQLVALLGLTAFAIGPSWTVPLGLVTCLAYVGFVTVAGQALAWAVIGVRTTRIGRVATWSAAGLLVSIGLATILTHHVGAVLDRAPTTDVVNATVGPSNGVFRPWLQVTPVLVLMAFLFDAIGRRACEWSLRQPGDLGARISSTRVRRRALPRTERAATLATDRASVWRSAPLRRGLLVLSLLPGGVAAVAGLEWSSLVLLPGLVSAGAGLLFGVNAFCLDGSGAVWLETLPRRPSLAFWSKAQVVAETCLASIVLTLGAALLRVGDAPTKAQVTALASCSLVALARVVALCMELSLTNPHRADLRGPRDTPAPPGVMAAYSAQLALSTTLVAILFSALAEVAPWPWPLYVAVPFLLLSARRVVRSAARWADPGVRARVVTVVASG